MSLSSPCHRGDPRLDGFGQVAPHGELRTSWLANRLTVEDFAGDAGAVVRNSLSVFFCIDSAYMPI